MHTHESPVSRKRSAQIVGATILDFARARDEFTRGELSEESGLSQSILTRGLRTLIAEDRIRITREDKSKPGRPVQVLSYNPESELVIVVNVTQNANELRVLDQQGNALVTETFDIDDEALESIIDATAAPITRFGGAVRSLVVAVEGVATGTDGDIVLAPWFSGNRRSLRRKLEARVGLPVLVDNDVNLRALGESRRRGEAGAADMLYFYVGASGVGAVPIVDGELRRGSDGRAGEIGFLPVFDDNLPEGDIGTFERRWSANGILDQLPVRLREKAKGFRDLSVLEALRRLEHDSIAVARLRQQAEDAWFRALLICCCVLAPSTIVVAGAAAFLSDDALRRGQRYLADRSPYPPDLIRSTGGQDTLYLGSLHLSQVAATSRID